MTLTVAEQTQQVKKPITTTSRVLIWLVAAETILVLILFLSGFTKLNPYLLFAAFIGTAVFIYWYFKRPRELDFDRQVEIIKQSHYKNNGKFLNSADAIGLPIAPDVTYIYFPNEGLTFDFRGKLVKGIIPRHLYPAIKQQEKSRLFESSQKFLSSRELVKQQASAAGIDVESLGLE